MTEQKPLSYEAIKAAIGYVRDPHPGLRRTARIMDFYEIGARRFINWLACNGYVVLKLEQDRSRLAEKQVREYIRRYYPKMGEVDIEIDGHFVSVREKTDEGSA